MDDWQDLAFSTRHYHNRLGRGAGGSLQKHHQGSTFDAKRTFGRYDVQTKSGKRTQSGHEPKTAPGSASVEIFRFSQDRRGLLGSLHIPGRLDANLILAGSRQTLQTLVDGYTAPRDTDDAHTIGLDHTDTDTTLAVPAGIEVQRGHETVVDEQNEVRDSESHSRLGQGKTHQPAGRSLFQQNENRGDSDESDQSDQDEQSSDTDHVTASQSNFEKNSFRKPKFWFQWIGEVSGEEERVHTGRGYLVFSKNNCQTFKATITIDALEWQEVAISGRKHASMPERDDVLQWLK